MPVLYSKKIRERFRTIDLDKLKTWLFNNGYQFIRDGGFSKDDKPFEHCNYLFYKNPLKHVSVRIGYDYPFLMKKENTVFEICYATEEDDYWIDVVPDFRKNRWREVSKSYIYINGKYIKK